MHTNPKIPGGHPLHPFHFIIFAVAGITGATIKNTYKGLFNPNEQERNESEAGIGHEGTPPRPPSAAPVPAEAGDRALKDKGTARSFQTEFWAHECPESRLEARAPESRMMWGGTRGGGAAAAVDGKGRDSAAVAHGECMVQDGPRRDGAERQQGGNNVPEVYRARGSGAEDSNER